jgi:hypothetical protein
MFSCCHNCHSTYNQIQHDIQGNPTKTGKLLERNGKRVAIYSILCANCTGAAYLASCVSKTVLNQVIVTAFMTTQIGKISKEIGTDIKTRKIPLSHLVEDGIAPCLTNANINCAAAQEASILSVYQASGRSPIIATCCIIGPSEDIR